MLSGSSPALLVLGVGALVATIVDIRTRRIPNVLTAAMSGIGIAMALTGISGVSPLGAVGGFLLGLLLMMPGYTLGATGAGDVKLMAAVGAIVGPGLVVTAFLFTAIAGGVLALGVAAQRGRLAETLTGTGKLIAAPVGARRELAAAPAIRRFAYGPAIAVGSVVAALVG